jgi:hypothetical protein
VIVVLVVAAIAIGWVIGDALRRHFDGPDLEP